MMRRCQPGIEARVNFVWGTDDLGLGWGLFPGWIPHHYLLHFIAIFIQPSQFFEFGSAFLVCKLSRFLLLFPLALFSSPQSTLKMNSCWNNVRLASWYLNALLTVFCISDFYFYFYLFLTFIFAFLIWFGKTHIFHTKVMTSARFCWRFRFGQILSIPGFFWEAMSLFIMQSKRMKSCIMIWFNC